MSSKIELGRAQRDALCVVVGDIVIRWAKLEALLDGAIAFYHELWKGPRLRKRPRPFSSKIEYLELVFSQHPVLNSASSIALPLLSKVKLLADDRNWIVHGSISALDNRGTFLIQRTHIADGAIGFETRQMTFSEMLDLRNAIYAAHKPALFLVDFVSGPVLDR